MKAINWKVVAEEVKTLYPAVLQIAHYSRNRWFLVIEQEAENFLTHYKPLTQLIRKHKLPVPLIISTRFIQSSLDSYPLEFLDIQSDYTNLFVRDDVIENLVFNPDDVRLQIERELKSKWLLTRLVALEREQDKKHLFQVLKESFTSLIPVFKGFCQIGGTPIPKDLDKLLDQNAEILRVDMKVLKFIATQPKSPSHELTQNLFNDYVRLLGACSDVVDNWKQA
jgi:hypothetical protein